MKANSIFIAISFILLFTGCRTYEATFEKTPLKIDGSSSDWKTTLDSKNNDSYSYGISNDMENLYIRININDLSIQKKVMLAGLTVWIDTTGKKKETSGITCPIQKIPSSKINRISRDIPRWDNNQILDAEFIGFEKSIETYYITNNPYEIEVSIDQDEFKSLYYEMKIPFKSIYSNCSNISLKTLSIGLETGTIKMPSQGVSSQPISMTGGGKGGRGGRGGGGGGRGSGGMSEGKMAGASARTPHNSSMTDLTRSTKIWIKNIHLANPKNHEK